MRLKNASMVDPKSSKERIVNDCRECASSVLSYSRLLCTAMMVSKPVEYMRHENSECGPSAMLFEPKTDKRYAEYDRS